MRKQVPSQTNSLKRADKVPVKVDVAIAVGSAIIASGMVTPIILTIDKAVVQSAAGTMKLMPALISGTKDFLYRPQKTLFSFPLLLVWCVYGSTYIAANLLDVYNERMGVTGNTASMQKLFGTTVVNMSASLVKDVAFAKMFGKQFKKVAAETANRVPAATYLIFLARDTLTIAGGFTVPPLVSSALVSRWDMKK